MSDTPKWDVDNIPDKLYHDGGGVWSIPPANGNYIEYARVDQVPQHPEKGDVYDWVIRVAERELRSGSSNPLFPEFAAVYKAFLEDTKKWAERRGLKKREP